jgi:hypothetical protein
MNIRKVPLQPLIQILTDLFDSGADFIDISGEQNEKADEPRDMIKILVKPEYMMKEDTSDENMIEFIEEEIEMDYTGAFEDRFNDADNDSSFSDEDIDNLI